MKTNLMTILLCLVLGVVAHTQTTRIIINAGKTNAKQPVYYAVYDYEANDFLPPVLIDTTDKSGKAQFSIPVSPYTLFKTSIGGEKFMTLGIREAEQILIAQKAGNWTVSGSETSDEIQRFRKDLKMLNEEYFAALTKKGEQALQSHDQATIDSLTLLKEKNLVLFTRDLEARIQALKNPVAVFNALSFLDDHKNLDFLETQCQKIQSEYPGLALSNNLVERIKRAKSLAIGAFAPAISTSDREGKMVNLAQYKGKYLLLDFWASWCLPCRIENPSLKALYADMPRNQFDIISISLDENSAKWTDACDKDGLHAWCQVQDASQQIAALYGVKSLPQNVLLDKDGKILVRNLNVKALRRFLAQLPP